MSTVELLDAGDIDQRYLGKPGELFVLFLACFEAVIYIGYVIIANFVRVPIT